MRMKKMIGEKESSRQFLKKNYKRQKKKGSEVKCKIESLVNEIEGVRIEGIEIVTKERITRKVENK